MSFSAVAFDLSDAQLASLPSGLIGLATSVFSRNQLGKLGFGEKLRFTTRGADRFRAARDRWAQLTGGQTSAVPAGLRPSSPICFAAFSFDARSSADSVITVPEFVLERTADHTRLHYTYDRAQAPGSPADLFARFLASLPDDSTPSTQASLTSAGAHMTQDAFRDAVNHAVDMLAAGEFTKIVLARDERLTHPAGIHLPATLRALAEQNPTAWTYRVDRLLGSTPELLIARQATAATARVLAGTVDRDVATDQWLVAEQLTENPKQLFEHRAAVDSLVEKLAPFATRLRFSPDPFVLTLPNVYHLATDVAAEVSDTTSVLDLVGDIHPTAAVGGTPRGAALDAIWRLEAEAHGMDRGLYSGAVGWLDAHGQGEFGIALRGSVLEDAHSVRVYAGGGIVAGSEPAEELAETHAKMRPMKKALRVNA